MFGSTKQREKKRNIRSYKIPQNVLYLTNKYDKNNLIANLTLAENFNLVKSAVTQHFYVTFSSTTDFFPIKYFFFLI